MIYTLRVSNNLRYTCICRIGDDLFLSINLISTINQSIDLQKIKIGKSRVTLVLSVPKSKAIHRSNTKKLFASISMIKIPSGIHKNEALL